MSAIRNTAILISLASISLLAGCDGTGVFSSAPGKYSGYVVSDKNQLTTQYYVAATITAPTGKSSDQVTFDLSITTQDTQSPETWNFHAEAKDSSHLAFSSGDGTTSAVTLTLEKNSDSNSTCFISQTPDTRLCYNGTELTLDLTSPSSTSLSFVLDRGSQDGPPGFETPASYTVQALITHAMSESFTSRIEFERVTQAKLTAQVARENLLPHLSVGSASRAGSAAASAISSSVVGLVSSVVDTIGDLVPFLLPDRWSEKNADQFAYDAEKESYIAMKVDAGSIAEGLVYALSRDMDSLASLKDHRAMIENLYNEIQDREKAGLVQIGTSADLGSIMNSLDQESLVLNEIVSEELTSLSEAAGFVNPGAVSSLSGSVDPTQIDSAHSMDPTTVSDLAIARSVELRQMDDLIQMAQFQKDSRKYQWMDPSGDSSGGLGFGLGDYIEIGQAKIDELMQKRQELQADLLDKVNNTSDEWNEALQSHQLAEQGITIQNIRINRLTFDMLNGLSTFDMGDLVDAIQGLLNDDLERIRAKYAYFIAYSKMNRILFAGPYAHVNAAPPPSSPQP